MSEDLREHSGMDWLELDGFWLAVCIEYWMNKHQTVVVHHSDSEVSNNFKAGLFLGALKCLMLCPSVLTKF